MFCLFVIFKVIMLSDVNVVSTTLAFTVHLSFIGLHDLPTDTHESVTIQTGLVFRHRPTPKIAYSRVSVKRELAHMVFLLTPTINMW